MDNSCNAVGVAIPICLIPAELPHKSLKLAQESQEDVSIIVPRCYIDSGSTGMQVSVI